MSWGRTIGRRMAGTKLPASKRKLVPGGRWRYFMRVVHHDLHPTKGWRKVKSFVTGFFYAEWRKLPHRQIYFKAAERWKSGRWQSAPSDAGRWMRNRDVIVLRPQQVDLMAHGWYRRKMKLEPQSASDIADVLIATGMG